MLYSIGYNIAVNINGFCFYCYCYPIACDFILFSNDTFYYGFFPWNQSYEVQFYFNYSFLLGNVLAVVILSVLVV